uniref:NADH dehydrogenase [ubiquinone] 1 alpha subcomplex subunit 13 n=1 Tax=Kalanchoe fedtschenkoi TaxID=63787 RepID=A0A7N0VAK9_KALFE
MLAGYLARDRAPSRFSSLHSEPSLGKCMKSASEMQREALKEEKEKYAARRAILPMLQAEEDERFVKEWKNYLAEEARIMKDVPGWKVGESVYNSGRWMPLCNW